MKPVWSWSALGTQHAEIPFLLVNTGLPWSYVLSSVGNILSLDLDDPIVPTQPEITSPGHGCRIPNSYICPHLQVPKLFAALRVPLIDASVSFSLSQGTSAFSIYNHLLRYGPSFSLGTQEEKTA